MSFSTKNTSFVKISLERVLYAEGEWRNFFFCGSYGCKIYSLSFKGDVMRHWKDVIVIWKDTKGVVIVGVVAAMYAAVRIPFVPFQIIPGFTEIRPGAVVPPLAGMLFGPAACWGAAVGNLIGDVFTGLFSVGSIGGVIGNFLFAYIPYRLWWRNLKKHIETDELEPKKTIPMLIVVGIVASLVCASTIAWFVDMVGLVPLIALAISIFFNNASVCIILLPILYFLILPRMRSSRLLRIPKEGGIVSRSRYIFGLISVVAGASAVLSKAIYAHGTAFFLAGTDVGVGVWAECWYWYVIMILGAALL